MSVVRKAVRAYYRLRSIEVEAGELRWGDRLLFDFPGTGPYFTHPVVKVAPSLRQLGAPEDDRPGKYVEGDKVWVSLADAGHVAFRSQERVRIARARRAVPGTSDHGFGQARMGATRNVAPRGEPGRLSSRADEEA